MSYCCVPFCKSNRKKMTKDTRIPFHEFPVDHTLKQKWIILIARKDPVSNKLWQPSERSVVCGLHFDESCYVDITKPRLKKTAVPSCNLRTAAKDCAFKGKEKYEEMKPLKISKQGEKVLEPRIQNCTSNKSSDAVYHPAVAKIKQEQTDDYQESAIESADIPERINIDSLGIKSDRYLLSNSISSNSIVEKTHECNELRSFSEDAVSFDYSAYDSEPCDSNETLTQKLKTMIAFNKILQEKVKMCEKEVNILKGVIENLKLINSVSNDSSDL